MLVSLYIWVLSSYGIILLRARPPAQLIACNGSRNLQAYGGGSEERSLESVSIVPIILLLIHCSFMHTNHTVPWRKIHFTPRHAIYPERQQIIY